MWKEAYHLALFEWKTSWFTRVFIQIFFLVAFLLFMMSTIDSQLEKSAFGIDLFFIIALAYGSAWSIPKDFQYQKISNGTYASPVFLMLNQLPIKNNTLIRSRFIIFFINTLPILMLFFALFFITPAIRETLTVSTYIAFSLIWMSFSIMFGSIFPASDLGDRNITNLKLFFITLFVVLGFGLITTPVYIFYGDGVINLTIHLAQNWPIISATTSVTLAIISIWAWLTYANSSIKKVDFLE